VLFVAHLPLAVVEGFVLGFVVSFLARVKPELLGLPPRGIPGGDSAGEVSCSHQPAS
jgi:hypothetical protein